MTEQIPAAIQSFVDATNAADTEAFLACFTDDAYLNDWGREFHGHSGVASWNQSDNIGKQSHFEVVSVAERGDEVVVTMEVSGNGYNGTGPLAFTLDGELIKRLVIS
ncbi:nuclear transport factor 2 family protein [Compostimonas suwonensis]|uniref:SnoaL-like protein n=1 Tax=Compostimonas suwonensis TaxID=1048394 RepID=A0A2M9C3Z2_9MICO|nr:nuclear transport factor 2 family protein [Compostimonas suwonensis]PJJ65197.1 SnoaL-like protein [Compostimonas suwonensis]